MKKFEVGKKYNIMFCDRKTPVGTVAIIKRTDKFVTYTNNFFKYDGEIKVKVEVKNNVEMFHGFYQGVYANEEA